MITERWKSLEERALWVLAHGEQVSPRERLEGMAPLLRLWQYRSNGSFTSWTILTPIPGGPPERPLVREIAWDRPLDLRLDASRVSRLKRRQSARASLRIRDVPLNAPALKPHLEWAARLPPGLPGTAPSSDPGQDLHGVEGFQSLTHLRFEWAGDGPAEWTPIRLGIGTLLQFLQDSLRERETGP